VIVPASTLVKDLNESWLRRAGLWSWSKTSDLSKISDTVSDLSKISEFRLRLLNINGMKTVKINGNRGAQQEIPVSKKNFKRSCTISTGIPKLQVRCKK